MIVFIYSHVEEMSEHVTKTENLSEKLQKIIWAFYSGIAPTNQFTIIIIFRYLQSKFLRYGQRGFSSSKYPPLSFKMTV